MSQHFEKLKTLLKELFQLDQPDLDFGLYRIMHAKSAEVSQFLDKDLLPQVQAAFGQYKTADKSEIEKELAKVIAGIEAAGMDPEQSPIVKDLRERLKSDAVDLGSLEREVYDHLFSFFRRYYDQGDFLSKRVYKPGVYAIPYEGEEVKLHWANADQYYIKTSEYLRDYAFRLRPEDDQRPMRVHFRLVDAAEGEHGNVKAAAGKERRFALADEDPLVLEQDELVIRFTYQPREVKQKELNAVAELDILQGQDPAFAGWREELARPHRRADGNEGGTRLRTHLDRYTARNTFDYFIHKDLGTFLRRELDFFIKNEVMHLDDVEHESAPRVEQYLSKIKVIRRIAGKIIDFLAQLEDFQKKLWLKKKFVVETSWCLRLGVVPEAFLPEIALSTAQVNEWQRLHSIDELLGDLTCPAYTVPLSVEFLKANPTLMVDTRHFDAAFTARLLEAIGDVDAQTDGVLFHSENFQALSAMQRRYSNAIDCIYIDPPYNAKSSEILYKNTFKHSSFLSFICDRIELGRNLLKCDSLINVAIDDYEHNGVQYLLDLIFGSDNFIANVVVQHNPRGRNDDKFYGTSHEYMIVYSKDRNLANLGLFELSDDDIAVYRGEDEHSMFHEVPFMRTGNNSDRTTRPNLFYPIYVDVRNLNLSLEKGSNSIEILPINSSGEEKTWRWERSTFLERFNTEISVKFSSGIYKLFKKRRITDAGKKPKTIWSDSKYDASSHGIMYLRNILGKSDEFSYPKSIDTTQDSILISARMDGKIVDFFAGSGTSGHAVINLNRKDGGRRKFILVEMGEYFDAVIMQRLKKIVFTPEWKDGKPKRLATPEEVERSPGVFKVLRMESYEDTLNNLETHCSATQQLALDAADAQGADGFKEQYLLRYMLDVETRGSQSLLNVQAFNDPTAYKLKVKRPGSDESRTINVDLLETFNWLVGLTVQHMAAPQCFTASFQRDSEGRLRLQGRLKQEETGPYWFRTVTGTTPDGRRTLIIWRKLTGVPEEENLVLDEWFTKQGYSAKDSEFDLIYVNGGNNLENLKTSDDLWKVRLIEEDFHRLMFETEGA